MGQISVNLPDEMLTKIDNVIREVNGDSLGDQVVMLLEDWIQLAQDYENQDISKEGTMRNNNAQEKYVAKEGYKYRVRYHKKDGLKPEYLYISSHDLSKLNELSLIMQECDWDRTEWKKQTQRLFPESNPLNHIYSRSGEDNNYYVQWKIMDNCYQFGYHLAQSQAVKIRDYIKSLNNEEKVQVSYQHYGVSDRDEYTREILELSELHEKN